MYRKLLGTVLLVGGMAVAQQDPTQRPTQDPTQPPTRTQPTKPGDATMDRSTAQTMGEQNRAMNQANDKKFAANAAIGGMAEVQLGQMAAEKASDADVKAFGQRMVSDHTKVNDDLKNVAAKQSIDLPTSLDSKHKATVDRLSKLSGSEFDRAYVREMVKDHDGDVKEFQKEAQNGTDTAIRSFASSNLPTLEDHQKSIHELDRKLSGKASSSDRSK
jgi:putative membrane protein